MNICPVRYTPYTNNTRRRQRVVDPNRARSSQGMRVTQQRCSTQQSPNRTPSQGELQNIEIPTQPGVLQSNYQQLFLSTQIRRSPSFRLKNYHPQENAPSGNSSAHQKRPSLMINTNKSKEDRINRINFLGDLLQQMEHTQVKQSLSTEMATVPKTKFEILNTRTLTEYEQNIEELHFYLVESQQRTKQQALAIEKQKIIG